MDKTQAVTTLKEPLVEIKGSEGALETLNKLIRHVEALKARFGDIPGEDLPGVITQVAELSRQMKEQDAILKAQGRQGPKPPTLFTSWLEPDDPRTDRGYHNLVSLTPHELRYGASVVTQPKDRAFYRQFAPAIDDMTDVLIRELQQLNDQLYVADLLLYGNGHTSYARISLDPSQRMHSLKLWKRWEQLSGEFQRALGTGTAGTGGNWVPTQISARLIDLIAPELRVAALFPMIDMPTKAFDLPVLGADILGLFIAEAGSITAKDPTTNKVTLTAVKMAARNIASTEVLEDAAIAMEPFITSNIAKAVSRAIEGALENGDTNVNTASAQDNDMLAASSPPDGSNHHRKAWDGLRKKALISGMSNVDLATFSVTNLLSIKGGMGVYGAIPSQGAWLVGFKGFAKLLGLAELITLDKFGPQATILTGQVGNLLGSPVILSEFVREDVNSTGVNGASANTFTTLRYINRESFAVGRRRDIQVARYGEVAAATDEINFIGTWRGVFAELFATASAANKIVGIGRNFS